MIFSVGSVRLWAVGVFCLRVACGAVVGIVCFICGFGKQGGGEGVGGEGRLRVGCGDGGVVRTGAVFLCVCLSVCLSVSMCVCL